MNIAGVTQKIKSKIPLTKNKLPKWKDLKSNKKLLSIIAGMLVVILCITIFAAKKFGGEEKVSAQSAFVTRGSVTRVIEGSGTIEAVDQYNVTSLVKGEILADYFEEGQEVEKGDLLYSIDTSDIENSIEKSEASLEKSQLSYQQSRENVTNLTVRSTISGTVNEVYIANGDNVGNNSKVADIINSDYMRLKINFNYNDAQNLYAGQSAQIYLATSSAPITGEVENVATGSIISPSGAPVTPVEIVVANPGAIQPGDIATAIVGDYACNDSGTFEYYETATIMAKSSGEAYGLAYKKGDKISKGAAIVYLESTSAYVNARQSELSLKDSELALKNLIEERDDYSITAPISGKVIQKNSKAGDKLDNSTNNTTMAIIADLSSLVFEISVDELDISNIKVGQYVSVTADALEGRVFTGHVDNVSIVGTSSNGVTSYPVKVVMDDSIDSGLIPGMNVNASIVIDSREDVLRIPVSALNRGNIVYVKSDSDTAKNSKKDNADKDIKDDTANQKSNVADLNENKGNKTSPSVEFRITDGEIPEDIKKRMQERMKSGEMAEGMPERTKKSETAEENKESQDNKNAEGESNNSMRGNMSQRLLENMQKNAPDGYTAVIVEIGLSDDSFTEIISGLEEGDEVYLPDTTAANNTNPMAGMMGAMHGGIGAMHGGMGAMPGGMSGMSSGRMPSGSSMGR